MERMVAAEHPSSLRQEFAAPLKNKYWARMKWRKAIGSHTEEEENPSVGR